MTTNTPILGDRAARLSRRLAAGGRDAPPCAFEDCDEEPSVRVAGEWLCVRHARGVR